MDDRLKKYIIFINYIEMPMKAVRNISSDTVYEDC